MNVTGIPDIGLPFAFVAMTSSGLEALLFGKRSCPLPPETLSVEPAPCVPTVRLNTLLPALDVAITEIGPSCAPGVNLVTARPVVESVTTEVWLSEPELTWKVTVMFGIGLPLLFTAMTSRSRGAMVLCSSIWLLPLVIKRDEPRVLVVGATGAMICSLKTALPAVEVAMMVADIAEFPALNVEMTAFPLASVVALAVVLVPVKVPEPAVTTVKVTGKFEIGEPALFNAKTSRLLAVVFFSICWLLPLVIKSIEPSDVVEGVGAFVICKLNATFPAFESATMVAEPVKALSAVKPMLALPLELVLTGEVVLSEPAPDVATAKLTANP